MTFTGKLKHLTFFAFLYTILSPAFAQWSPTGADPAFPRTLLKASELPAVRQSLQEPERLTLYTNVYNWAMDNSSFQADNSINSGRTLRSASAKNKAFVRLIKVNPYNANPVDTVTLQNEAILLLESMNTAVGGNALSNTDWQWRSKELLNYLTAYDLLLGSGVPETSLATSKAKLQEFTANLYSKATSSYFGIYFFNTVKNNHALMTASALGMAGVVLNDSPAAGNWINAGMYNIDNVMWKDAKRQSIPGVVSGYSEGPYYFKYAMMNCLPFFRAMGNFLPDGTYGFTWNGTTRQIRHPYHDPNYDLLYQWITDIAMPDGRMPALEDTYIDMAMPELAIAGKPQFVKNFYPQNLEAVQLNDLNEQLEGTIDLRANYLAANVTPLAQATNHLTMLPASGNLIFRSGTGFTGNYLHVYGKNGEMLANSGGHNHGDAGSFSLYSQGQLLALDAGYLKYEKRDSVGKPTNHNLVLVNGAGPKIGTSGVANDAQAYIQNSYKAGWLAYGEAKTTYEGAIITRKTLSVRGDYYLMADFISAAAPQNYTWQLHGYGLENGTAAQGTFTGNLSAGEGTWQKNGVSLRTRVTATDGASSFTTGTNIHEITYDKSGKHTTFFAGKNGVAETQFLAALMPFTTETPVTETLNLNGMAGLVKTSDTYTDLAVTKADTLLQTISVTALPQTVQSDANFTFYSLAAENAQTQLFLQNGTAFLVGSEQLAGSSKRADILLEQTATGEFNGYISKAATLQLRITFTPSQVTGDFLSSWTYDVENQTLEVTFAQPSAFKVQNASGPLPVELVYFRAEKVTDAVNLTWQTAGEKNNRSFAVQRSTDGKTWNNIASVAGQGTTAKATAYSYRDTPDFSGQIYYRLQQEDFDGSRQYSPVQVVDFEKNLSTALLLYPNPATEVLHIKTGMQDGEKAEIRILDLNGTEVYRKEMSANANDLELNVATLPAGFYIVSVQAASQARQAKFIKN